MKCMPGVWPGSKLTFLGGIYATVGHIDNETLGDQPTRSCSMAGLFDIEANTSLVLQDHELGRANKSLEQIAQLTAGRNE